MEAFTVHRYTWAGGTRNAITTTTTTNNAICGGNVTASAPVSAPAIGSDIRTTVAGTPTGGGDEISDVAGCIGIGGTNKTTIEG